MNGDLRDSRKIAALEIAIAGLATASKIAPADLSTVPAKSYFRDTLSKASMILWFEYKEAFAHPQASYRIFAAILHLVHNM